MRLPDEKLNELGLLQPDKSVYFPLFYGDTPGFAGLYRVDVSRAVSAGLTFRPTRDTILSAVDWFLSRTDDPDGLAAGLKATLEKQILSRL